MNIISQFLKPRPVDALSIVLDELAKHGMPRISKYRNGWVASVTIEDSALGKRLEISSDLNHADPNLAVQECRERLQKLIEPKN